MDNESLPSEERSITVSKYGVLLFDSTSSVNLIEGSNSLIWLKKATKNSFSITAKVSSTYRNQIFGGWSKLEIARSKII